MADRYDKSFTRKPASPEPASQRPSPQDDPLVELARIVSGNQSFDDIVGRPAQPSGAPRQPAAQRAPSRDSSFDLESELLNDLQSSFDPGIRAPAPRAPEPRQPQAAAPQRESFDHMRLRSAQAQQPQIRTSPREAAAEEDPYSGTAYAAGDFDRGADPFSAPRTFSRTQPAAPPAPAADPDDYYYEDEPAEPAYDDGDYGEDRFGEYDGYDAEPPRRSRKLLIAAAIGLAVILAGGLAALALKDRGSSTGADAPKVIAADDAPTKVQPAAQPSKQDGQENKLIFDRADPDASSQEQLVLPDDGAVDAPPPSNESAASREISRIILPGAPGDNSSAPSAADGAAAPAEPAADAADDGDSVPRKVRTVVIKPDGTIVSSEAKAKDAAPSTDVAAAAPAAPDAAPAVEAPAAEAPSVAAPAADAAPAAEPAIIVPEAAPPAAEASPAPPQKDTSQMAEPKPAAPAKPAARAAPAQSSGSSGGFVVQVTAQRSEDQAAAAFRALQRKYPDVLGSRSPDIVRADLGAKGVYYRARVGPMASRDEAISLCEALKAAGGDCIVQKN